MANAKDEIKVKQEDVKSAVDVLSKLPVAQLDNAIKQIKSVQHQKAEKEQEDAEKRIADFWNSVTGKKIKERYQKAIEPVEVKSTIKLNLVLDITERVENDYDDEMHVTETSVEIAKTNEDGHLVDYIRDCIQDYMYDNDSTDKAAEIMRRKSTELKAISASLDKLEQKHNLSADQLRADLEDMK